MNRSIIIRTLKTAFAALGAFLLANFLGLDYAAAAAVIAILNVFETRRSTIVGGLKRSLSAVIAMVIGGFCFEILGYSTWVFGIYLLFFVPVSFLLKIELGLGPSSVIVTHLLAFGTINKDIILNELALVFIGTGFALLTNFYAPSSQKDLKKLVKSIDSQMKFLLKLFGTSLKSDLDISRHEDKLASLDSDIEKALKMAKTDEANMVSPNPRLAYDIELRKKELRLIKNIYSDLKVIPPEYSESTLVGNILIEAADKMDKPHQIDIVASKIDYVKDHMETMPLPQNHLDFKIRATVFEVFRTIEEFVDISDYIVNKPALIS